MSTYNRISFYGGETMGTPAYLTNSRKETAGSPAYLTFLKETAGSPAYLSALRETAGSPAYLTNAQQSEKVDTLNFRGYDSFEKTNKAEDKKISPVTASIGALAAVALIIGGLGYAHKVDVLSKMKDGNIKDILTKIEPVAKTCHEWCSVTKTKGNECLENVKKFFKSKNA